MKKAHAVILPVAVVLLGLSVSAYADDHDAPRLNIPADKWLPVSDVLDKLKAQGYTITEIEADDGVYEFEGTTKDGVRIEGHANPATGKVLHVHND